MTWFWGQQVRLSKNSLSTGGSFKLQHPLPAQEELKTRGLGGCLPACPVLRRPWVPRLTQAYTCLALEGQRPEARIWVCTARRKRELNLSCVKRQGGLRCVSRL